MKQTNIQMLYLGLILCLLCGCGYPNIASSSSAQTDVEESEIIPVDVKEYYTGTEIKDLETFTSVTGIELNIADVDDRSNSTIYNYLMDANAAGYGAIVKYEHYIESLGFQKDDRVQLDEGTLYSRDEYGLITASFVPADNVLQYVICVYNNKIGESLDGGR